MDKDFPTFPPEEFAARVKKLREHMAAQDLSACLLSTPENIYYFSGLDHWGYFAFHALVVPRSGNSYVIARKMESVTMGNQLPPTVEFRGYLDSEQPAEFTCALMREKELDKGRIGMDMHAMYRSYSDTKQIIDGLPKATWVEVDETVRNMRFIKSARELDMMRVSGRISEKMTETAIRLAGVGVSEQEIAAEVCKEMILAGGEPPSFGPFLRPSKRIGEEHGTWGNDFLIKNDRYFIEVAGSYKRYHAPMGRLIYLNQAPAGTEKAEAVCLEAFDAVVQAMKPGVTAHQVYRAWQDTVDKAGLQDYQRHHCGYMVGMSYPPSWMEFTNRFVSLRKGSELELKAGMCFHVLSWLLGSRAGDYFVSNTVAVLETGAEVLTRSSQKLVVVV